MRYNLPILFHRAPRVLEILSVRFNVPLLFPLLTNVLLLLPILLNTFLLLLLPHLTLPTSYYKYHTKSRPKLPIFLHALYVLANLN